MTNEELRRLCEVAVNNPSERDPSLAILRLLDENDAMRGVVDAACGVTSIWEKMKAVENLDIRKYYAVMQEFCDEYGALKISLNKLGERT